MYISYTIKFYVYTFCRVFAGLLHCYSAEDSRRNWYPEQPWMSFA